MGVMEAPEKEKDTLGTLNTEEGVRGASLDALGNAEGPEGCDGGLLTLPGDAGAVACSGLQGSTMPGTPTILRWKP